MKPNTEFAIYVSVVAVVVGFLFLSLKWDKEQTLEGCLEKNVFGCGGDKDCIDKANKHCRHLIPKCCEFTIAGVLCDDALEDWMFLKEKDSKRYYDRLEAMNSPQ